LPSEEELNRARRDERDDGWGILPGVNEAEIDEETRFRVIEQITAPGDQVDDRGGYPAGRLARVEAKVAMDDIDIELHTQWIMELDNKLDTLEVRQKTISWCFVVLIVAVLIMDLAIIFK